MSPLVFLGVLLAAFASRAEAHVEKQFKLPDFLRQPFFDVSFESAIPELADVRSDRVVSVNHLGKPVKCLLPDPILNSTLRPLAESSVHEARKVLASHKSDGFHHFDDVWGWIFQLNDSVAQFFPPVYRELPYTETGFYAVVGRNNDAPGFVSLDDAEPVVIDDQYMLHARYVNGSHCDLTLEPRITNLFFACSPTADLSVPVVLSIDEPYSCTYEFVIGLKDLCNVDGFGIPSKLSLNTIRCGLDPDLVLEEPDAEEPDSESHYVDLGTEPVQEFDSNELREEIVDLASNATDSTESESEAYEEASQGESQHDPSLRGDLAREDSYTVHDSEDEGENADYHGDVVLEAELEYPVAGEGLAGGLAGGLAVDATVEDAAAETIATEDFAAEDIHAEGIAVTATAEDVAAGYVSLAREEDASEVPQYEQENENAGPASESDRADETEIPYDEPYLHDEL